MSRCNLLPCWLAVQVLIAHTHCVLVHGQELAARAAAYRHADAPVGNSSACDNESSCICKGATLAAVVAAPADEPRVPALAPCGILASWVCHSEPSGLWADRHTAMRPLCAQSARAWLQRFLL